MWEIFKKYWDIISGILLSIGLSFIASFQVDIIQLYYSIILLSLTCIGTMRVIKLSVDKAIMKRANGVGNITTKPNKKKKRVSGRTLIDGAVDTLKPIKAMSVAEAPLESGEKIGNLIIGIWKGIKKVMKKIKTFFKWLWAYRQQIIGILGEFVLAVYTTYLEITSDFGWVITNLHLPQTLGWQIAVKVVVGLIAFGLVAMGVRNQCKWVGFGSLQTALEYLEKTNAEKVSNLSADNKKKVKVALTTVKKSLKTAEKTLTTCQNAYDTALAEYNNQNDYIKALSGAGADTTIIAEQQALSNSMATKLTTLKQELTNAQATVNDLTNKVEAYTKMLD